MIVDDWSHPPLEAPSETPLSVRVMHQEDRGFGAARARNKGARAASGDILLFLDCDMVPEADWLAIHARWHHAASDVLTLGFRTHLDLADIGAETVRGHAGDLADLFAGRPTEAPQWIDDRMARTDSLTSDDELIFRVVTSGNLVLRALAWSECVEQARVGLSGIWQDSDAVVVEVGDPERHALDEFRRVVGSYLEGWAFWWF